MRIRGLARAAHYNGRLGVLRGAVPADPGARVAVALDGADGPPLSVRRENLDLLDVDEKAAAQTARAPRDVLDID